MPRSETESDSDSDKPVTGWWAMAYTTGDQVFHSGHSGFKHENELDRCFRREAKRRRKEAGS